jgi:hypothetical protein
MVHLREAEPRFEEAQALFHEAREIYQDLGDAAGVAGCDWRIERLPAAEGPVDIHSPAIAPASAALQGEYLTRIWLDCSP